MVRQICQSLIEFESKRMDLELDYECRLSFSLATTTPAPSSFQYVFQSILNIKEDSTGTEDSLSAQISSEEVEESVQEMKVNKTRPIKKTRKISKNYRQEASQDIEDSSSNLKKRKSGRGKVAKSPQYPTKNFLPNFKGPHLQFLATFLKSDLNEFPIISQIRAKDGISLKDYEALYNQPKFTAAFEDMFKCNFLYRQLLLSRSSPSTKKIHQRKLYVFKDAFRTKVFPRINY